MNKMSKPVLLFLIVGITFLYIPLVSLVITSFSESDVPGVWTHFSLKWYTAVFQDRDLIEAAFMSVKIAIISATVTVVLGVLAAMAVTSDDKFFSKKLLKNAILIPVIIPEIIIGFSLLMLFITTENSIGLKIGHGIIAIVIGHVVLTIPYAHLTIKSRLSLFDRAIEDAAANLGAKAFTVFVRIKLPVILQSIMVGWILAFALSLDDLVVASFLSGPGTTTLPILIFSNLRIGITPELNAFAALFMGVVALCTIPAFISLRNIGKRSGALQNSDVDAS
ncbi:MAG: ABC transporter permease [Holosporales bacterium]|jgi:putrescine transport system permease protein|nr:ABC transporter permease [Holosporales bacterium]